jgi:hypothetical protein
LKVTHVSLATTVFEMRTLNPTGFGVYLPDDASPFILLVLNMKIYLTVRRHRNLYGDDQINSQYSPCRGVERERPVAGK